MANHINHCVTCEAYTMQDEHCGEPTISIKPPRYTPEDKYAAYVREAKKEERTERGLI